MRARSDRPRPRAADRVLSPGSRTGRSGAVPRRRRFRPLFRFFMWQQRLGRGAKVALVVVPLVAVRLLGLPSANPAVLTVVVAWYAFVVLTWVATPLANVVLRFSPRGRAILPAAQKR